MFNISKNDIYFQIGNRSTIIDELKSPLILLKYMKISPISNDLIQALYLELDEDKIIIDEYFTKTSILSI